MASVDEMRRESRLMHQVEPNLSRLNTRQFEYLQNSLRKSLQYNSTNVEENEAVGEQDA